MVGKLEYLRSIRMWWVSHWYTLYISILVHWRYSGTESDYAFNVFEVWWVSRWYTLYISTDDTLKCRELDSDHMKISHVLCLLFCCDV